MYCEVAPFRANKDLVISPSYRIGLDYSRLAEKGAAIHGRTNYRETNIRAVIFIRWCPLEYLRRRGTHMTDERRHIYNIHRPV